MEIEFLQSEPKKQLAGCRKINIWEMYQWKQEEHYTRQRAKAIKLTQVWIVERRGAHTFAKHPEKNLI